MVLTGGTKGHIPGPLEQKKDAQAAEGAKEALAGAREAPSPSWWPSESRSQTSSPKKEPFIHFLIQQPFTDYIR